MTAGKMSLTNSLSQGFLLNVPNEGHRQTTAFVDWGRWNSNNITSYSI